MSSRLEGFIAKCPQWMLDLLPQDLIKAIKGEIHAPTSSGRKTAIDDDNINDVAYFMRNPKGRKDPLDDFIKGTKDKPYQYAISQRKWKSIIYLCGALQPQSLLNVFKHKIDSPTWYKYLYVMLHNAKYSNTHIPPENFFPLIYDCPEPIACIRMLLRDYQVTYKEGFTTKRVNNDKEKDEAVFKSLKTDKIKIELVKYIKQNMIDMDVDDAVLDDGNLTCICMLFGYYNLCYYVVRYGKIEEFKKFVDENRSSFDQLGECHIIMPQFRELYEYAYSKAKNVPNKVDYQISKVLDEHAEKLAKNLCENELRFMISKGYEISLDCEIICLKTFKRNMISFVPDVSRVIGNVYAEDFNKGKRLFNMGYYMSSKSLSRFYQFDNEFNSHCKNFEIIECVDPKEPLDSVKFSIASFHPELLKSFVAKYGDRLKDSSAKSWSLDCFHDYDSYIQACEVIGIDPKEWAQKLFDYAMVKYSIDKKERAIYRKLVIKLINTFDIDLSSSEHMEDAIKYDDLKLGAELIRHGANIEGVHKWKKRASYEMYKVIMENM